MSGSGGAAAPAATGPVVLRRLPERSVPDPATAEPPQAVPTGPGGDPARHPDAAGRPPDREAPAGDDGKPPRRGTEPGSGRTLEGAPEEPEHESEVALHARTQGFGTRDGVLGERPGDRPRGRAAFFTGGGPDLPRAGPLTPWQVRRLQATLVETPAERELVRGLSRDPVRILAGAPGTGRTVTALAAVARHAVPRGTDPTGRVHLIEGLPPDPRHAAGLPANSGLVLVLRAAAGPPGRGPLADLARTLAERRGVLVIVADTAPTADAGRLVRHTPPGPDEVFDAHLRAWLGPVGGAAVRAAPGVAAEIRRCRSLREAAGLAERLAAGFLDGLPVAEVLAEPVLAEELAAWQTGFGASPGWRRTFAVAVAVLDAMPLPTVVRAAEDLYGLLPRREAEPPDTFGGPAGRWSPLVGVAEQENGPGRGLVARLRHPGLREPILRSVWRARPGLRDPVLTWIHGLAGHPDVRVRVKVAQAVAEWARHDFPAVLRAVLDVGARDGRLRPRQVVAWALEALAFADDGVLADRVRRLVGDWAGGADVRCRATALAAYGTFLGARYPGDAFAGMRRVVERRLGRFDGGDEAMTERDEEAIIGIVRRSLLDLFAAGAQAEVVWTLAEWAGRRHPPWRKAAADCLVRLATRRGDRPGLPVLMELADERPELRLPIVLLWRNALESRHPRARQVLHDLAADADRTTRSGPGGGPSAEARRFRALTRWLLTELGEEPDPG
ncbi:hypothetical protein [Rhizohabitans arisaemae]|uniref:hypothetical protein n=1 Tax=Rhizohabitans arisaemae TaxID=2720610 RepID=UPI0024B0CA66|nr:hypothetical protein [Rhizohabitans arisaemae]